MFQFLSEPWDLLHKKEQGQGTTYSPLLHVIDFFPLWKTLPFFKKAPSTPSLVAIDSIDQNNNVHLAAVNFWMSNFEQENVIDLYS